MTDLVIRGGSAVLPDGLRRADISIEDGRITGIETDAGAGRERDRRTRARRASRRHRRALHFNEPGRTEWEGAATGSRALAAGGGTTFFDMPLNSTPCCVNAREDRPEARGARGGVHHRLRPLGWPRTRLGAGDGRNGRPRRRRLQGLHVRLRSAGVSTCGRCDALRRLARGRKARSSGRRPRGERRADARRCRSACPEPRRGACPERGEASRGVRDFLESRPVVAWNSRRFSVRCSLRARRTRRCTSFTSARGAASRAGRGGAREGRRCLRARHARTT